MAITHSKVSATGDGGDSSLVRPSDWNDDHAIGNGTITEAHLSISDNTTKDVSTSAHGFCPKAPNDATKYLCGDGSWADPPGVCVSFMAGDVFDPSDGTTYYFGTYAYSAATTLSGASSPIPISGTITAAGVHWYGSATTTENLSIYVCNDNSDEELIETIGIATQYKNFTNYSMSLTANTSYLYALKVVCPTWSTNPTSVRLGGWIYIVP